MALFGRGYDEGYGRNSWSGRDYYDYNRDYTGWGGNRFTSYGEDYAAADFVRRYGPGYKSRWETDYGDPFGDRQQRTPMRVIRGEARGYDRGLWRNEYDRNYPRHYPFGYLPYETRAGYDTGYRQRAYRPFGRRYDSGWY